MAGTFTPIVIEGGRVHEPPTLRRTAMPSPALVKPPVAESYVVSLEAVILIRPPETMNERIGYTYGERMQACFADIRRDTPGPVWKTVFGNEPAPQLLQTTLDEGARQDSPFHISTGVVRMWWEADIKCESLSVIHQSVNRIMTRLRPFADHWNGLGWRMKPLVRLCSEHSDKLEKYVAAHGTRIGLSLQPTGRGWHSVAPTT